MLQIYGVPFSAHTRKVILAARHKGLGYEIVPTVPLNPPENWRELSPTGKIPVLADGNFTLPDSSVICAYLEKKVPTPSLYPAGPRDYARALWLEEFVDSGLQQHVLEGFLLEVIFAPLFLNKETNWDKVNESLEVHIPAAFAYLENQTGGADFLAGSTLTVADIALTSILINYSYGGQTIDASRYPNLAAYFQFMLRHETVSAILREEVGAASQIAGMKTEFLSDVL